MQYLRGEGGGEGVVTRRNKKQRLCKICGGVGVVGANKVHCGKCASGVPVSTSRKIQKTKT